MNDQGIEVLNTSDCRNLRHFNTSPTTPRVEFICQKLIRVIVALNASDLAILIEFQPLSWIFDLDVQDQSSVDNFGRPNLNFSRDCPKIPVACML